MAGQAWKKDWRSGADLPADLQPVRTRFERELMNASIALQDPFDTRSYSCAAGRRHVAEAMKALRRVKARRPLSIWAREGWDRLAKVRAKARVCGQSMRARERFG